MAHSFANMGHNNATIKKGKNNDEFFFSCCLLWYTGDSVVIMAAMTMWHLHEYSWKAHLSWWKTAKGHLKLLFAFHIRRIKMQKHVAVVTVVVVAGLETNKKVNCIIGEKIRKSIDWINMFGGLLLVGKRQTITTSPKCKVKMILQFDFKIWFLCGN